MVVTVVVTEIFFGPKTSLAVTRAAGQLRRRSLIHPKLRPPVVIGGGIAWHGPGIYLTRPSRPTTKSFLPQVLVEEEVARVHPGLRIKLVFGQSRRGVAKLSPPAVVTPAAVEAYYGPATTSSLHRSELNPSFRL